MRLADQIIEAALDPRQDGLHCGALSSMASALQDAQHFEIGPAMLEAANRVRQVRPSTMVAALPMVRYPYRTCWFEWLGGDVAGDRASTPGKPTPQRLGVLVDCDDKNLQQGQATWAWIHQHSNEPVVCPIGVLFDNSSAGDLAASMPPLRDDQIRQIMQAAMTPERFRKLIDDPREVAACAALEQRTRTAPTLHTWKMFQMLRRLAVGGGAAALASAFDDLEGEPPFLYAIVILLNSRNVVTRETEDLTRLNRARARQRKQPLLPFVRTNIVLSRVQGRRAGTGDPIERRRHLVMGHFKVRATGVYWWSPHQRGPRGDEVRRTHYAVEADRDLNRELAAAMETK